MVLSAVIVMANYFRLAERQAGDSRGAFLGRLNRDLAVVRQDGSSAGLLDLAGDVWVVGAVSVADPTTCRRSIEVMGRLAEQHRGRPDFHLVCLTVDPEGEPPGKLAEFARGIGAQLPQWWFAAAGQDFTHKFLKDKLKLGMLPHRGADGKWVYDASLVVIDRNRHLRGGTVAFDFEAAARWDAEGRREGIAKSNLEELEDRLRQLVAELLEEQAERAEG
jgi:cytochrome oxidase Cu insertion factor (SCO1/SenC/PrrC family)